MKETWKDIKGYEGLYFISTFGRVCSVKRRGNYIDRIIAQTKGKKGYMYVGLHKEGIGQTFRVNRLVAQTFISNPDDKLEVNHKDGIKSNNKVDNLEWCTHKENMEHASKIINTIPRGENSGKTNLTDKDVILIREYLKDESYSMKEIAGVFNISQKTISLISLGKSWQHLLENDKNVGKHRTAKGSKNAASKLNENNVREIRKLLTLGNLSQRKIAKMFGVDRAIIGRIKNGTAWKYVL